MSGVAVWSSTLQADLLDRIANGEEVSESEVVANDDREGIVALLCIATGVTGLVLFFCWKYRAYKNLSGLGAPSIRMSPGGSVGWYFCPIANLWKPFQAMSDIADGSAAKAGRAINSGLLALWWIAWIADGLMSHISLRLTLDAEGLDEFITATQMDKISSMVAIPSDLLTVILVWTLTKAQLQRWRNMSAPPSLDTTPNPYAD